MEQTKTLSPSSFGTRKEIELLLALGLENHIVSKLVLTIDPNKSRIPSLEITILPTEEQLTGALKILNISDWKEEKID